MANDRPEGYHADRLPPPRRGQPFSAREQEIIAYLRQGHASKEIALALGLRPKTVDNHVHRMCQKRGVGSRLRLALEGNDEQGN